MIVLGLTGSIGMGKSTAAKLLREAGIPVHDADEAVSRLYAEGGLAVEAVSRAFPQAMLNGAVDRERLSGLVLGNPDSLKRLEAIVHPLVKNDRAAFLAQARAEGAKAAVLEIQLLFEVGAEEETDAVIVVSAPPAVQQQRVMLRPGMNPEKFQRILARQMPDAEKRARAGFVVDTGKGLEETRAELHAVLATVMSPRWTSRRKGHGPA